MITARWPGPAAPFVRPVRSSASSECAARVADGAAVGAVVTVRTSRWRAHGQPSRSNCFRLLGLLRRLGPPLAQPVGECSDDYEHREETCEDQVEDEVVAVTHFGRRCGGSSGVRR